MLVGAGTVRADDPSLTVRHVTGPDPFRVVLGTAPAGAKIHPCVEMSGDLGAVLDDLGGRGVLQLLVEGGATVAHHVPRRRPRRPVRRLPRPGRVRWRRRRRGLFRGPGAPTIDVLRRGHFASVSALGLDVRLDLVVSEAPATAERAGG